MDPYNSFDVNVTDCIFHEVFWMKTGFYQINAANEPLFGSFALLKTNVASSLKLGK